MKSLVSIIIPTYNRAHLILETLDSIIAQTYYDWECIVIDDCSTDTTADLLNEYCKRDSRIQYYLRPSSRVKGANACRNYGFELSKGEFVHWFDSDDIMLTNHIEILVDTLQKNNIDFVVGDTVNFEDGITIDLKLYDFDKNNVIIDAIKFAKCQIGWVTNDFMARRNTLLNLRFNEQLQDGHEYNLFLRYLLNNYKGLFINQVLTRMRVHSQSIGKTNRQDEVKYKIILAKIKILTLEDILMYDNNDLNKWLISGYMHYAYLLALNRTFPPHIFKAFSYAIKVKNLQKALFFLISILTVFFFKKGYSLNKYSRS